MSIVSYIYPFVFSLTIFLRFLLLSFSFQTLWTVLRLPLYLSTYLWFHLTIHNHTLNCSHRKFRVSDISAFMKCIVFSFLHNSLWINWQSAKQPLPLRMPANTNKTGAIVKRPSLLYMKAVTEINPYFYNLATADLYSTYGIFIIGSRNHKIFMNNILLPLPLSIFFFTFLF